jgi:NAD(P)-dependent dehydrogenase (short-subunit alcohol dehydrogenase family)
MATPDNSMAGKVCLVTGATAGIGRMTAQEIARRGGAVVIVGRNEGRCAATVQMIRKETSNKAVDFLIADMSSQAEIRRLAREFAERHDRLHVLVNNAGGLFSNYRKSVDGIELTFALNHLGYFLLTHLLLDLLKASAPARIVNVASGAHFWVREFDFDSFVPEGRKRGVRAFRASRLGNWLCSVFAPWKHPGLWRYSQTKLANLLFTYELARRLEGTSVTANALNPGLVASNLMSGNGLFGWIMRRYTAFYGGTVAQGAKTPIYLATSPEVEGVTGQYFDKRKPAPSTRWARDVAAAQRLWQLSEQLTGIS